MATLITGASSGIGAEFARQLAARGDDLILVARRSEKLDDLAAALREHHGVGVITIQADLARDGSASELWADIAARGLTIDTLINNAGFGTSGDVADDDPSRLEREVQLNCGTLTALATHAAADMKGRGAGTIINLASIGGFQPVPHMAVYAATKAYVLSFTEALWAELRPYGVRVLAVCPGPTRTEFFDTAGENAAVGRVRSVESLVAGALRALRGSEPSWVQGLDNKLVTRGVVRVVPKRLVLAVGGRAVRPVTDGPD